jgi:hypothetical protein
MTPQSTSVRMKKLKDPAIRVEVASSHADMTLDTPISQA